VKDYSFASIYSENVFSGIDRVSDTNALTAGVTTRLLDATSGVELLQLGIVQRYLFNDQLVTESGVAESRGYSDVLLRGSTRVFEPFNLEGYVRYSPSVDRVVRTILGAQYAPGPFRTLNLTYRYARDISSQWEASWQWPIYQPGRHAAAQGLEWQRQQLRRRVVHGGPRHLQHHRQPGHRFGDRPGVRRRLLDCAHGGQPLVHRHQRSLDPGAAAAGAGRPVAAGLECDQRPEGQYSRLPAAAREEQRIPGLGLLSDRRARDDHLGTRERHARRRQRGRPRGAEHRAAEPDDDGHAAPAPGGRGPGLRALPRQPARPDPDRAAARARGLPAHPHHRHRHRQPPRAAARAPERRCRDQPRADPGHGARGRQPRGAGRAPRAGRGGAGARARRRRLRGRGARSQRGRQPRARRRHRPAAGLAAAGRLRRAHAHAEERRDRADPAALGRRLPRAQAHRAPRARARRDHADTRAPRAAAHLGTARPAHGGAPAGRVQAPDRGRHGELRGHRPPLQRRRQRRRWRRPRLVQPGPDGAGVRDSNERAAAERPVRSGGVEIRRAPDPGAGAPQHLSRGAPAARAGAQRAARAALRPGLPRLDPGTALTRLRRAARAAL
jgi:hypothetical protein